MSLVSLLAVALFAAITAAYLKKKNQELSLVLGIAVAILLFVATAQYLTPVLDALGAYFSTDALYLTVPLKVLGLSLLGQITISVCEDAGEKGIAAAVGTAVKFGSVFLALPLFETLLAEVEKVLHL